MWTEPEALSCSASLRSITKSGRRREVPLNGRADAVLARRGPKSTGLVFGTRRWDHFRKAFEGAVARLDAALPAAAALPADEVTQGITHEPVRVS